jgi:hypothetical protein
MELLLWAYDDRMRAVIFLVALFTLALVSGPASAHRDKTPTPAKATAPAKPKGLTDAQIKRRMIQESIDAYSGNCPCPYNTAANGSSCGGRSAWSRAGGAEPLCFPADISADMVAEYRATHQTD